MRWVIWRNNPYVVNCIKDIISPHSFYLIYYHLSWPMTPQGYYFPSTKTSIIHHYKAPRKFRAESPKNQDVTNNRNMCWVIRRWHNVMRECEIPWRTIIVCFQNCVMDGFNRMTSWCKRDWQGQFGKLSGVNVWMAVRATNNRTKNLHLESRIVLRRPKCFINMRLSRLDNRRAFRGTRLVRQFHNQNWQNDRWWKRQWSTRPIMAIKCHRMMMRM